jgi:predicted TIM-barrel fold metal-dependent hydrolase
MTQAAWSAGDKRPALLIPEASVDCHHHIYDNRFPYDTGTTLRPPDASVAHYRQLQARLGLRRSVVVQPSSYGTDNRCLIDALTQFGDNSRGIAVIDRATTDADLKALDAAGVRGIRFNLSRPAGAGIELLGELAARVVPLGWHVQIHTLGDSYPALESALMKLPTTLVIDHLGRIPGSKGIAHPGFATMRRLVDRGNTWVKVSGAYHDSSEGAPLYADTGKLAATWLREAPERVVWGTDWPHVAAMAGEKPMPDDAQLLDLLGHWQPNKELLRTVLVDNPEQLYGFSSTPMSAQ